VSCVLNGEAAEEEGEEEVEVEVNIEAETEVIRGVWRSQLTR